MSTVKIVKSSYIHYKNKEVPLIPEDILTFVKGIVYTITNKINKKVYVGQTMSHSYQESEKAWIKTGIISRWRRHITDAERKPYESQFHEDILKFGENNFEIEIYKIISVNDIHKLNVLEFNTIHDLNSLEPNGYNKTDWKNSNSFTKHIFLKYFNLEDKIPSLSINSDSKDRAQQKCVVQHNILNEFIDKELEQVEVKLIKNKGKINQVKIVVKIKDKKDKTRTTWYLSKDPINIIKMVVSIGKQLKEDAFIDPRIEDILNNNDINTITYKYQTRLNDALKHEYIKISGLQTYYSAKDFYSYLLILSRKNDVDIRYSFGGKTVDLNDAYKEAREFVDKILEVKKVNNVIIREPESCHQQQATTKVAKITFVD